MSSRLQAVKGMPDILPLETPQWQHLETQWRALMNAYGYEEIRFPLIEKTGLFKRSIGEVTDIVEKEMFTFLDRDEDSITLRPEGTAGCIRAGIEHGLLHNQIRRLWYTGPMFRYEKPQKGRYRQFHQFGVEAFGLEGPDIEVEHLLMMARLLKTMNVEKAVKLQLNSLGSDTSRQRYRTELILYFEKYKNVLDEDSQRRLYTNPLRILDSKNPLLTEIIQGAPKSTDYLDEEDKQHFDNLLHRLKEVGVQFEVNPCLVRGLDYYNRTVYEWVTDQLGAQGTICAGGRYDSLVEQLGGKSTFGVGFAIGIERLILLQKTLEINVNAGVDVYFVCVGEAAQQHAFLLAEKLRDHNPELSLIVDCGGGGFKHQFKRADKALAKIAFILGENELAEQKLGIKFLREEQEQMSISFSEITTFLTKLKTS